MKRSRILQLYFKIKQIFVSMGEFQSTDLHPKKNLQMNA